MDAVHGSLPGVTVVVGGALITAEYAREIGANGFAPDAGSAVDVVLNLIEATNR